MRRTHGMSSLRNTTVTPNRRNDCLCVSACFLHEFHRAKNASENTAQAPMHRLRTLGEVTLLDELGRPVEAVQSQPKRFALLIYLATHVGRACHSREAVLSVLWPEADDGHGRNALRQSLHFLRRHLGDDAIVSRGDGGISVNVLSLSSDVRDFEACVDGGEDARALEHYGGPFLLDFPWPGEPEFEGWMEDQRRWLQEIAARCAWNAAVTAEDGGDLVASAGWWRRASVISPYDEAVAQRLVGALVALGNRGRAVEAFRRFQQALERDLSLQPSGQTLEIVRRTLEDTESPTTQEDDNRLMRWAVRDESTPVRFDPSLPAH
ncbi:MAG: AfsR/SARP family transcriptional regulator [Planctomycetota bacterium]